MAPGARLERATFGLTDRCFLPIELPWNIALRPGFEPRYSGWKPDVLTIRRPEHDILNFQTAIIKNRTSIFVAVRLNSYLSRRLRHEPATGEACSSVSFIFGCSLTLNFIFNLLFIHNIHCYIKITNYFFSLIKILSISIALSYFSFSEFLTPIFL